MPIQLSERQQAIVDCASERIVVKACPGSGKTFSVAARMARLLKENGLSKHQGIAAISFTNTACEVIKHELRNTFNCDNISYPSFIGTIDSFINTYIFLPYAHLVMQCDERPEIVGTEYNKWYDYDSSIRNFDRTKITDPNYYFDKVSFDLHNNLLRLAPYQAYHFGKTDWENPKKQDGSLKKVISDLIEMKKRHFKLGKANQSDANYIAYCVLRKYPSIAATLVERFPIFIIDEAQDTTELQMAIINIFDQVGAKSIMLIGDPDQAIFEWNTANPTLFIDKYNDPRWASLDLSENRRSSEKICCWANRFWNNAMTSVSEQDRDYPEEPQLLNHKDTAGSINQITEQFIEKCKSLGLNETQYAVVYRGRNFGAKFFGLIDNDTSQAASPWKHGHYYVRDIVQGKFLIDCGQYKRGLALIEMGLYKMSLGVRYVPTSAIKKQIQQEGFRDYRARIVDFIQQLPSTDKLLTEWIVEAQTKKINLLVETRNAAINIGNLFRENDQAKQDRPYLRTMHSVKGMSLEAILVFLRKKSGTKNYVTLLNGLAHNNAQDNEELRVVYVACTRPKKILWLAVPEEDVERWRQFLVE